jgi:hypothetical protein
MQAGDEKWEGNATLPHIRQCAHAVPRIRHRSTAAFFASKSGRHLPIMDIVHVAE